MKVLEEGSAVNISGPLLSRAIKADSSTAERSDGLGLRYEANMGIIFPRQRHNIFLSEGKVKQRPIPGIPGL